MRRALLAVLTIAGLALVAEPASGYLKLGTRNSSGGTVTLKWQDLPVRYFVSNVSGGGVSAPQLEQAVSRGFAAWTAEAMKQGRRHSCAFPIDCPTCRNDPLSSAELACGVQPKSS